MLTSHNLLAVNKPQSFNNSLKLNSSQHSRDSTFARSHSSPLASFSISSLSCLMEFGLPLAGRTPPLELPVVQRLFGNAEFPGNSVVTMTLCFQMNEPSFLLFPAQVICLVLYIYGITFLSINAINCHYLHHSLSL